MSDFGKIQKPHTDPRKHQFASETICTQCSHIGEGSGCGLFLFCLSCSGTRPGPSHHSIPTAEHGAHTKHSLCTVTERLHFPSCAGFLSSHRGGTWSSWGLSSQSHFPDREEPLPAEAAACSPQSFAQCSLRTGYYVAGMRPGSEDGRLHTTSTTYN